MYITDKTIYVVSVSYTHLVWLEWLILGDPGSFQPHHLCSRQRLCLRTRLGLGNFAEVVRRKEVTQGRLPLRDVIWGGMSGDCLRIIARKLDKRGFGGCLSLIHIWLWGCASLQHPQGIYVPSYRKELLSCSPVQNWIFLFLGPLQWYARTRSH